MEMGPILRALMHNKTRFWLIALEVALTMAIVINCVNMILGMQREFAKSSGYDEDNIVVAYTQPFGSDYKEEDFVDAIREEDLRRLRATPGVVDAAGFHQVPLSGSGSATGRKASGTEMNSLPAPYFVVTDHALSTLGAEIMMGRDFQPEDFEYDQEAYDAGEPARNVLVSRALADAMFPDGNALGQVIVSQNEERSNTIVGIVATMQHSWPRAKDISGHVLLFPGKPGDSDNLRYLVRAETGAVETVYASLEETLRSVDANRVITVRTLEEVKKQAFEGEIGVMKILTVVSFLLVGVTSLGIVGLTAFSVTQRTRQIGTRRALGATKADIVRYFLVENWMITGFGLGFGVLLTYGLNFMLVRFADIAKIDTPLLLGGLVMLWATGVLAALAPALRATRVAPEIATRTI